jgi:SPP1 gp7 family putative phage head morphogenesis protein
VRIYGPRLRELDHHGDAVAELIGRRLRYVGQRVAREFQTINDVNVARSYWAVIVDMTLLPAVETAWTESVDNTYEQLSRQLGDDAVTAALSFPKVVLDVAEAWLARSRNRLIGIGDLLWSTMRTQLTEGMSLGESIPQLRDRIVGTADLTVKRAESVARTEVIGASNAGSFYQMKATGLRATKEWLAANDDRTRPSHKAVDGTVVDMDEKFTVGGWPLDFPHDPTAPPEETINCRCTLAWDIPEEDAVDLPLVADAYHLPGRHEQKDHGNHKNRKSRDSSNTSDDSQDDFDTRITKAYVDSDVFTRGSQYSSLSDFAEGYEASRGEGDPTTSRVEGSFGLYQTNYESINTGLRTGDLDDFDERVVGYMNAGLERSATTSDVVVYRGISNPKKLFGDAWNEDGDNSGLAWTDPAYMSTTTSAIVARSYATTDLIKRDGVMMRLLVKSGTPSMPMRGNLSQLLLGAGRTSKIVHDYVGEDGFRTIDVEVS